MNKLSGISPEKVFEYFEQICNIPHGSYNSKKISDFCVDFAKKHSLDIVRDNANNVIIFKDGTPGYEKSEPIILQGHIDMVCQKEENYEIDFEKEGIKPYIDGDFIKAEGTTLGADNGIAVAMIMSILASDDIPHPPIEAIFTTDEEVGLLGAMSISVDSLKGKKMINLDSEDPSVVTVSCAGGVDCLLSVKTEEKSVRGKKIVLELDGLKSGHSGVEINSGRVNASMLMGRVLNAAGKICPIEIISVNGGDKTNVIPGYCKAEIVVEEEILFVAEINNVLLNIQKEIANREPDFFYVLGIEEEDDYSVLDDVTRDKVMFMLLALPNGVMEMSIEIDGLVETSLNLGILRTCESTIDFKFACRSNKQSALDFLENKLKSMAQYLQCNFESSGHYPPWEFNNNSTLQVLYSDVYKEYIGEKPSIEAIHAGLECGAFSSKINDLDCISIGPKMDDIHTVNEKLSISSTEEIYKMLLEVLKRSK